MVLQILEQDPNTGEAVKYDIIQDGEQFIWFVKDYVQCGEFLVLLDGSFQKIRFNRECGMPSPNAVSLQTGGGLLQLMARTEIKIRHYDEPLKLSRWEKLKQWITQKWIRFLKWWV